MNEFSDCFFCPDSKCFFHVRYPQDRQSSIKRTKMTGLTKVLKDIFYPDYVMEKPKRRLYSNSKVKKSPKKLATNNPFKIGHQMKPQERGNLIHDQIKMLCDDELTEHFFEKYTYIDDRVKLAISWMKANGWEPIANELAIADPETGIATAIDAIVYHPLRNKYAIVEWKTGDIDYFYYSTNGPCKIIDNFSNTLYNQARLQILMTYHILEKNYKNLSFPIDSLIVVHIGDDDLHENYIGTDFIGMENDVYKVIKAFREK